ncbi:MAG: hypothetical protein ACRBK7_31760 [Acidimicrobiales bacterium]
MKRTPKLLALLLALALAAAACGSDAATDAGSTAAEDDSSMTEDDSSMEDDAEHSDDAMEDDAMEDDAMEDDAMEDDAMEDDAMEDDAMEDDAMEEGELLGLSIVSIDFDAAEVVIANAGDAAVDLDGHFLCNFPDYRTIADVGSVEPGTSVTVPLPVALSPVAGELGLYTSNSFTSPDAIQAYVEWGSADHERSSVAEAAGIWDGVPLTVEGNMLTVG